MKHKVVDYAKMHDSRSVLRSHRPLLPPKGSQAVPVAWQPTEIAQDMSQGGEDYAVIRLQGQNERERVSVCL